LGILIEGFAMTYRLTSTQRRILADCVRAGLVGWLLTCPVAGQQCRLLQARSTTILGLSFSRFVSLPALKGGASRFTGHCLSSNVLLRSYAASTGRTGRSTRPPVFRQTPLLACEQRHWIVAKFAPFILSLKGEAFRCVWVTAAGNHFGRDYHPHCPGSAGMFPLSIEEACALANDIELEIATDDEIHAAALIAAHSPFAQPEIRGPDWHPYTGILAELGIGMDGDPAWKQRVRDRLRAFRRHVAAVHIAAE
jgi:hypothetical protein